MTFRPSGDDTESVSRKIANILSQLGNKQQMMHVRTIKLGQMIEATYTLNLFPNIEPNYVVQELLNIMGVDNVSVFNPEELQEP